MLRYMALVCWAAKAIAFSANGVDQIDLFSLNLKSDVKELVSKESDAKELVSKVKAAQGKIKSDVKNTEFFLGDFAVDLLGCGGVCPKDTKANKAPMAYLTCAKVPNAISWRCDAPGMAGIVSVTCMKGMTKSGVPKKDLACLDCEQLKRSEDPNPASAAVRTALCEKKLQADEKKLKADQNTVSRATGLVQEEESTDFQAQIKELKQIAKKNKGKESSEEAETAGEEVIENPVIENGLETMGEDAVGAILA